MLTCIWQWRQEEHCWETGTVVCQKDGEVKDDPKRGPAQMMGGWRLILKQAWMLFRTGRASEIEMRWKTASIIHQWQTVGSDCGRNWRKQGWRRGEGQRVGEARQQAEADCGSPYEPRWGSGFPRQGDIRRVLNKEWCAQKQVLERTFWEPVADVGPWESILILWTKDVSLMKC